MSLFIPVEAEPEAVSVKTEIEDAEFSAKIEMHRDVVSMKMETDEQDGIGQENECKFAADITDTKMKDESEEIHNYTMEYNNIGLQQQKEADVYTVPCFYTTIAIDLPNKKLGLVTGTLIDTGACAHFISRKAVDEFGLTSIALTTPKESTGGKGIRLSFNEVVHADIWLGGIKQSITAYVDDSKHGTMFIIGYPALTQIRLNMRLKGTGEKRETVVTVTPDLKHIPNVHYFVRKDNNGPSKLRNIDQDSDAARYVKMRRILEDVAAEKRRDAIKLRIRKADAALKA